jgi:hypothetical protein
LFLKESGGSVPASKESPGAYGRRKRKWQLAHSEMEKEMENSGTAM